MGSSEGTHKIGSEESMSEEVAEDLSVPITGPVRAGDGVDSYAVTGRIGSGGQAYV